MTAAMAAGVPQALEALLRRTADPKRIPPQLLHAWWSEVWAQHNCLAQLLPVVAWWGDATAAASLQTTVSKVLSQLLRYWRALCTGSGVNYFHSYHAPSPSTTCCPRGQTSPPRPSWLLPHCPPSTCLAG